MQQTMNSRCFTCSLLEKDSDLGECLTIITLRRVNFPHTPLILTSSEVSELQSLLARWPANGGPTQTREGDDATVNN
ncbi:MAG: hypothetical protein KDJ65_00515 [Anaerolineae bacterium]|nr:hypothetical protein [Anaerolineae bacterium]